MGAPKGNKGKISTQHPIARCTAVKQSPSDKFNTIDHPSPTKKKKEVKMFLGMDEASAIPIYNAIWSTKLVEEESRTKTHRSSNYYIDQVNPTSSRHKL